MATIIDGKELAKKIRGKLKIECDELRFNVYRAMYKEEIIFFSVCEFNEVRYTLQCDDMNDIRHRKERIL